MIINYLKASGFRIMGEPIEIEFPAEGKIGILGQNESGKTTFLQTIEYALYGLRKGAGIEAERENLVTWGKNEAKLAIQFTSGQDAYLLQRVIGAKSGHKASLSQVIGGAPDRTASLTSLKDIETKIEQITGMDRDSFTKLIYIKQKDLDALRELAKSKREQLVNKVMGIELFDDATAKVKTDTSNLDNDLENKKVKLDSVSENKDNYEKKKTQKEKLEASISSLEKDLAQQKNQLDEAKTLLKKYDWLSAYKSNDAVKSSLEDQLKQVRNELSRITTLEKQISKYQSSLTKYKPQVKQLDELQNSFADLERRIREAQDTATELETKRQNTIQKTGLAQENIALLTQDLPRQKQKRLIGFLAALLMAVGLLIGGLVWTWILVAAGIPLFVVAAFFFYNYFKLDKLLTANTEISALTSQLTSQNQTISTLKTELDDITSRTKFKSKDDVDSHLSSLKEEMKEETGEETIDGIEALLRSSRDTKSDLEEANPSEQKAELERKINRKKSEIEELQKSKPVSVDKLEYEEKQHKLAKEKHDKLQDEYNKLREEIQGNKGTIKQLKEDLENLKADYEYYPKLKEEVEQQENQIELLKRVQLELSETSKELRNKVIPHARFIINEILPTLTDGRYSDFEITEDLKFKVHSNEAGGYKEREIFSGGTQDQFLIALRLAFTQSILDSRVMADKYSLLMDECISSSDDVRKQGIFEVLDAMKKTFSQIFVIAHEDISNFVDNHIVLTRNDHGYTEIRSRSW
jgi:exonuclease SbcC